MKIGNKEIKLFYNNQAAAEVKELCNNQDNVSVLIYDENGDSRESLEQLSNVSKLIRILANAEVAKNNMLIDMGVIDEAKQEKYTDQQFEVVMDAGMIGEYFKETLEVMGIASRFEVPEEIKLISGDTDLEELEAEKNPCRAQPETAADSYK